MLTAREADVLECAIDDASIDEIAKRVHLSPGATRNYLSSAIAKLGVSNRYEAALEARKRGWV
jgi:two-component system response regulator DesR